MTLREVDWESMTLEEMNRRAKEARERMFSAGEAFEEHRQANPLPPKFRPLRPSAFEIPARPSEFEAMRQQYRKTVEKYESQAVKIAKAVAKEHGFTLAELKGPRRTKPHVRARWAIIKAVREGCPGTSLPQLGTLLGRDHTTVIHALRSMGLTRAPTGTKAGRYPNCKGGHDAQAK